MTRRPSYQECLDAGMSYTETPRARGVTVGAVSCWARKHGVQFRNATKDPEFKKANSERMKRLNADPEFNPLAALTREKRADYDTLKRAGYTRPEALRAIGRADLLVQEAAE